MPLSAGARLGTYEVGGALGAGGMGEVYAARDTRLGRNVALKLLPDAFACDADRVARFEREAKLLASLNFPGIAALYGLEESENRHFLVMELVEGETLAERIQSAPRGVPVEEALKIAIQIAEALEFAHDKGIIHRDLKPANVKITPDGKVKVLDFGLAKALEPGAQADILTSPTLSVAATVPGLILGTAPYMSPEQAKGRDVDQRSDIFSFGAVLFEMLTGRHCFDGDTVTDVIASVLARQPDLGTLPAQINPRIEDVIRGCLEKDVKRRRRAIGDVRMELEAITADPQGLKLRAATAPGPIWKRALPFALTAVVVAGLTAATVWNLRPASPRPVVARFTFSIPEGQRVTRPNRPLIDISPDGARMVYVANSQLYLRNLAELEARPIHGTSLDPDTPLFSPDGRWVAFHSNAEGRIKKVAVTGGASITLLEDEGRLLYGGTWASNGQLFLALNSASTHEILRLSGDGGKAEAVITFGPDEFPAGPQLLPDGDSILFTLARGTGSDRWEKAQVLVQSAAAGRAPPLIAGGSDARYLATGHLVYVLGTTLHAVPYDVAQRRVTGGAVPVVENVLRAGVTLSGSQHNVSASGTMAYIPGGTLSRSRILALIDRNGVRKPLPMPPDNYFHARISPDGTQFAVHTDDGKEVVVSIGDLDGRRPLRRLTFGGANRFPIWTHDGQRIVFQSDREGDLGLYWQRAEGTGTAERLTTAVGKASHIPDFVFPDGKALAFTVADGSRRSLWSTPLAADSKPTLLIDQLAVRPDSATISPDGHWIAYATDDGSGTRINVQPLPPTGAKYQVPGTRAVFPVWSRDGNELFYTSNPGAGFGDIMSVAVQLMPRFEVLRSAPLGVKSILHNGLPNMPRGWDVLRDGKQFLVMLPPSEAEWQQRLSPHINITLNWFEELKQRVPPH